jgi:5-methylcytosine-specific restriction endonuclease McrA
MSKICKAECSRPAIAKGLCWTHYRRPHDPSPIGPVGRRRKPPRPKPPPGRVGRPPVQRVIVTCATIGCDKTRSFRINETIPDKTHCAECVAKRRQRDAYPCVACGKVEQLTASEAKHRLRCRQCIPPIQPMVDVRGRCEQCNMRFAVRRAPGIKVRFCSNPCRISWLASAFVGESSPQWQGGKHPYGHKWKRIRRAVSDRDGNRCRRCGKHESAFKCRLTAAHLIPVRACATLVEANVMTNLVALCSSCHQKFDRRPVTRFNYELGDRPSWPSWTHIQPVNTCGSRDIRAVPID